MKEQIEITLTKIICEYLAANAAEVVSFPYTFFDRVARMRDSYLLHFGNPS